MRAHSCTRAHEDIEFIFCCPHLLENSTVGEKIKECHDTNDYGK